MTWLALDIGGANIKIADGTGYAATCQFALWRHPDQLVTELRRMIAEAPAAEQLAATMTGELADCFDTKADGVRHIVESFVSAADGRHARIYLADGRLVAPPVALRSATLAAAANWHALASFAASAIEESAALLVDIGSTTTDIIPLIDGRPAAKGATDTDRLRHGELVYTGATRSPVCGVCREVPYRGSDLPVAQEIFASVADAYVVLGDLSEDLTCTDTADGRPLTRRCARTRLGRLICADTEIFNHRDAVAVAERIRDEQTVWIATYLGQVAENMQHDISRVVISGKGEFLARRVCQKALPNVPLTALSQRLGPTVSTCAPAHALATIARQAAAT